MDSQPPSTPNPSAVTTVPYDVLQEIFSYCLPDSPLDEAQPNPKIAPMLLCHVCSSWRITALESPHLWAYLYYRLPFRWENGIGVPIAWDSTIFLRNMECLKWWKQNQGLKSPFIRFEFYQPKEETSTHSQELPLTHDDIQFFVEYLSSAQYLDVGRFARYVLQQDSIYGSSRDSCPKLQHLVTSYPNSDENRDRKRSPYLMPYLMPFHIAPTLRRLRIHRVELPADYMGAFAHWSGLTHISLKAFMLPSVWFSLIRAVPNLQWGYFDIYLVSTNDKSKPPMFTLPYLDTLSVTLDNSDSNIVDEPFSQFLTNLYLPALRDLSVYIDADPINLPGAACEINNGLKSAPAITKLTLAFEFLGFVEFDDSLADSEWEEVDKLSTLAPRLVHLVLDMCYLRRDSDSEYEATLSYRLAYWKEFLPPTRWLDHASPASALRQISVVVREPSRDGPLVEGVIRDTLELDKAGPDEETKVVLEIVPEDKTGLAPYAEGYKTWGCAL